MVLYSVHKIVTDSPSTPTCKQHSTSTEVLFKGLRISQLLALT